MILETETFMSLLRDRAHWEFEIFLMVLFDGIILGVGWNFVKRHWGHHVDRDKKDGVWDKPAKPDTFALCSCGKMIVNITNPKFHGTREYWREVENGLVCVDNHWHAPMTIPASTPYFSHPHDAVDGGR